MTTERSLPHVKSINPVLSDRYHDWGRSAEGQAALARVLTTRPSGSAWPIPRRRLRGWLRPGRRWEGEDATSGRSLVGDEHRAWSTAAVLVAVAYTALAVGGLVWLARDLPRSIAPAPVVTEPAPATTVSAPASVATSAGPLFTQDQVDQTSALVEAYFQAVREGREDVLLTLFARADQEAGTSLYESDRNEIAAASVESMTPTRVSVTWWHDGRWLPSEPIGHDAGVDTWVQEEPDKRLLVDVTMQSGARRLLLVLFALSERPVIVPSTSTFGEVPASQATEVQGYLDALEVRMRSKGIPVLSVSARSPDAGTTDMIRHNNASTDPLSLVVVRVAGLSALDGPDGYSLVLRDLERQAAIMGTRGIPIRYLVIISVAADGSEQTVSGGLVADLIPKAKWLTPPRQALEATRQAVATFVQQAATAAGVDVTSVSVVEDDFGRTVTVDASASMEAVTEAKQFADSLDVPARELNDEAGSKIVTLAVKVNTPSGSPVVRLVKDYALAAGVSTSWIAR